VCRDPTPVHCNTVQGKMQSPLISAAQQDWLAAGMYLCTYTYEDLLFIQGASLKAHSVGSMSFQRDLQLPWSFWSDAEGSNIWCVHRQACMPSDARRRGSSDFQPLRRPVRSSAQASPVPRSRSSAAALRPGAQTARRGTLAGNPSFR